MPCFNAFACGTVPRLFFNLVAEKFTVVQGVDSRVLSGVICACLCPFARFVRN
jgi:hypothetical protein